MKFVSKIGTAIRYIGLIGMTAVIGYMAYFWLMLNYAAIDGNPFTFATTTYNMVHQGLLPMYNLFLFVTAQSAAGELIRLVGEVKEE